MNDLFIPYSLMKYIGLVTAGVYMYMHDNAEYDMVCRLETKEIAKAIGLTQKSVKAHIGRLERSGYLINVGDGYKLNHEIVTV